MLPNGVAYCVYLKAHAIWGTGQQTVPENTMDKQEGWDDHKAPFDRLFLYCPSWLVPLLPLNQLAQQYMMTEEPIFSVHEQYVVTSEAL